MAIKKPAPKPATKPAPQRPAPRPQPIDMVRDPSFEARMADRNYANLMRDQQTRLAAQGQYTQGRLMGAPTEQPNPNAGKPLYFQALEGELQKQFLDKNPQLKPKPGTALNPQLMQENYAKFLQNQMAEVNKFNAANPQYAQDIRQPNPSLARQSEQSFLEGLLDYSKVSPDQVKVLDQLKSGYLNQGQGGGTQPSIPQNQQMATYNNLLQQGIQRSNTMNQGAMTDFANMQAGAPTNQPIPPSGGMGGPRPDQNAESIQKEFGRYALGINKLMQEQPQQSPETISTIAGSRPAGQMNPQQMQAFQNFLNQGMNNMAPINQSPASNPASTQPRMQKATQAPRKFSTVKAPPARFA